MVRTIEQDVYCYRFTVNDKRADGSWREEFVESEMDMEELRLAFINETLVMATRLVIDKGADGKRFIRRRQEKLYSLAFLLEVMEATPPVERSEGGA